MIKKGAGYVFGKTITEKFLSLNGLGHLCRAHQLCMEGYQILFDDMLSTIWSAPNYCYRAGNLASVLEISPSLDRYFNVFGPCPEDERGIIAPMELIDRLGELLDMDGVNKKRSELLKSGTTSGHFIQDIYTFQSASNQVMTC